MSNNGTKTVSKTVRLLVSVAILGGLALRTDWGQVGEVFLHLRLELWLIAVALYLLAQVASAARWCLFARPLGFQTPLRRCVSLYFVGMFFNLLLPTSIGGDVIRAWYLERVSGRRLPAFLSVFVDRLSGLLILLALACVADLLCPIPLPVWIGTSVWATAGFASLSLLLVPVLARNSAERKGQSAEREDASGWSPRSALRASRSALSGVTGSLSQSLALLFDRTGLLISTTVLSLLVQGINVMILWLVGRAIGTPVPVSYCGIVVPMVTLLTLLPVSLNGMGVREGGMVLFLAPLGISSATALSLALLWFSVFVAASLFGGAVYLFGNFSPPGGRINGSFIGRDSDQGRARQLEAAA